MTIQISGWSTSLTDLEICTLALCATIIVCTIGVVFVVVGVKLAVAQYESVLTEPVRRLNFLQSLRITDRTGGTSLQLR